MLIGRTRGTIGSNGWGETMSGESSPEGLGRQGGVPVNGVTRLK